MKEREGPRSRRGADIQHKRELIQYIEKRIVELKRLGPLLELYGVARSTISEHIWVHEFVLEQLNDGKSKEKIIKAMRDRRSLDGRGGRLFYRDFEHFLETGKPMLPESLYDVPAFIEEEQRKLYEKEREEMAELRRQDVDRRQKEEADKKRRQQEEIAEKLGIQELIAQVRSKEDR